eukprot:149199-Pelagomonas_calceolata.AAC.3
MLPSPNLLSRHRKHHHEKVMRHSSSHASCTTALLWRQKWSKSPSPADNCNQNARPLKGPGTPQMWHVQNVGEVWHIGNNVKWGKVQHVRYPLSFVGMADDAFCKQQI